MAQDDHLRRRSRPDFWKFQRHQGQDHLDVFSNYKVLQPRMIMTPGKKLYVSIQPACPLRKMVNILQRKIAEMIDSVLLANYTIPILDHNRIHLVHVLEWTIEIGNAVLVSEMGIRCKECLHYPSISVIQLPGIV